MDFSELLQAQSSYFSTFINSVNEQNLRCFMVGSEPCICVSGNA